MATNKRKPSAAGLTNRALGAALGVSAKRANGLVNGPEWPFGKRPRRSDLPAIKRHMAERRAVNPASRDLDEDAGELEGADPLKALVKSPERLARVKLIVERTAKIKLERELLAGGYVKREDVEKERLARVYSVRAKLQELPLRSSLIAHKTEAECERILCDWMREVCEYYAGGGN